jgi:sulfatase modifying factor 1
MRRRSWLAVPLVSSLGLCGCLQLAGDFSLDASVPNEAATSDVTVDADATPGYDADGSEPADASDESDGSGTVDTGGPSTSDGVLDAGGPGDARTEADSTEESDGGPKADAVSSVDAAAAATCSPTTCPRGCCLDDGVCQLGGADACGGSSCAACGVGPSCQESGAGLTNCGAASESCCASVEVSGGTYHRTYTNTGSGPTGEADPASVSGFRLDKYLVTVGRYRRFVAAWNGGAGWLPVAGSGKHTHVNEGKGLNATGGGYEPGWLAADTSNIAPTDANLACTGHLPSVLAPGSHYATWTPSVGSQENLPINCVNWYEAYAFCIWDNGFLPSEAEWEYAAVGGSAERHYPWGTTAPGTDSRYAIYACDYPSGSGACTGVTNIAPVGTAQLGVGLWGQLDLGGNLWEWNLDWHADYVDPCIDCANFTVATQRSDQGGNFNTGLAQFPPFRGANDPADPGAYAYGFRCARTP